MKLIHINRLTRVLGLMIFLFSYHASSAFAQDDLQPISLTLTEAIQLALKQNPEVKAALHKTDAVASQINLARSGLFPQVYFTEIFNHTNQPMWAFGTKLNQEDIQFDDFDPDNLNDPDTINNFNSAVSLSWMLYDGGQTRNSLEQARYQHEATSLAQKRVRQNVIARTAKAYIGMLLSKEHSGVVKQLLETSGANLSMVESRFKNGFVVKSDLLRAQVRMADLEQQRLQAESQERVAQAMLNMLMGSKTDHPLTLETVFQKCVALEKSLEEWMALAMENRPELKSLEYHEEIAKKELSKSKAGHLPGVQLIGSYEINSEDFSDTADNYTIGAVMRLNLFSGNRISSKIKSAKSSLLNIKEIRKNTELGIGVQVRESYFRSQSAWERIKVGKTAVNQAEEGLRIVSNRYNNGLLTIVALLDAEVTLQQALIHHFRALHDYKTARIQLAFDSGTINSNFN